MCRLGHGGTLDPLATGVLPIALGEATKTVPYVTDALKCYRFVVTFGAATTTDVQWWHGWTAATTRQALADAGAVAVTLHGGEDIRHTPLADEPRHQNVRGEIARRPHGPERNR